MRSCCICGVKQKSKQVRKPLHLLFQNVRLSEFTSQEETTQTQGLLQSLITKAINNVQVTVKNIHIRYEDDMSVPGVIEVSSQNISTS
jgi:hypothetical protein